jgi:hypothetical protein
MEKISKAIKQKAEDDKAFAEVEKQLREQEEGSLNADDLDDTDFDDHEITEEDLTNNPELSDHDVKAGVTVGIPKNKGGRRK